MVQFLLVFLLLYLVGILHSCIQEFSFDDHSEFDRKIDQKKNLGRLQNQQLSGDFFRQATTYVYKWSMFLV